MKKVCKLFKDCFFSCFVLLFFCLYFSGCFFITNGGEEHVGIEGPTVVNNFPINNKTDVLLLFYMDGDNNLAKNIWRDLNEIEYGLYFAEENLSNARGNEPKIDIIVLWDGEGVGDSRLFKVGSDTKVSTTLDGADSLSKNTLDLTSTVPWIVENNNEVSMSNPKTLENFLRWAREHYIIDNNTQLILQFANHGKGPKANGGGGYVLANSRAMCEDKHTVGDNNQQYLWSDDVPKAIKNSGILDSQSVDGKKKIDLIIHDVCNGASIEEAYEYKDVADYMLLSPNEMPGNGLNYVEFIKHLKVGDCIISSGQENGNGWHLDVEKFLDSAVTDFIGNYNNLINWDKIKKDFVDENLKKPENERLSDEDLNIKASLSCKKAPAITGVKLKGIGDLGKSINNLGKLIKQDGIYNDIKNIFKNTMKYSTEFAVIYDIGELSCFLKDNLSKKLENTDFVAFVENVEKCLNDVILCSWRDGVNGALYNKSYVNKDGNKGLGKYKNGVFGLCISGIDFGVNNSGKTYSFFPGEQFYGELSFGKECVEWKNLLSSIVLSEKKGLSK